MLSILAIMFICDSEIDAADNKEEEMIKANTNLQNWNLEGTGELRDTVQGIQLISEGNEQAVAFSDTTADDFTYEADIKIAETKTKAGLIFRASAIEKQGYMIQIDRERQDSALRSTKSR